MATADHNLEPHVQRQNFVVLPATARDVVEIASLDKKMWGETANPGPLYRQLIDLFPDTIFVARTSAGKYAGCAVGLVRPNPKTAWVLSVDIAEKFRGQGLGKLFVASLLNAFRRLKIDEVAAVIGPANTASQRLFASFGFRQTELLPGYFSPGKDQQKWILDLRISTPS